MQNCKNDETGTTFDLNVFPLSRHFSREGFQASIGRNFQGSRAASPPRKTSRDYAFFFQEKEKPFLTDAAVFFSLCCSFFPPHPSPSALVPPGAAIVPSLYTASRDHGGSQTHPRERLTLAHLQSGHLCGRLGLSHDVRKASAQANFSFSFPW